MSGCVCRGRGEVIPDGVDAYSAGTVGVGTISGRGRGGQGSSLPRSD